MSTGTPPPHSGVVSDDDPVPGWSLPLHPLHWTNTPSLSTASWSSISSSGLTRTSTRTPRVASWARCRRPPAVSRPTNDVLLFALSIAPSQTSSRPWGRPHGAPPPLCLATAGALPFCTHAPHPVQLQNLGPNQYATPVAGDTSKAPIPFSFGHTSIHPSGASSISSQAQTILLFYQDTDK